MIQLIRSLKRHGGIPKLVEGTGLENQQVVRAALGFESLFLRQTLKNAPKECSKGAFILNDNWFLLG